MTTDPGRAAEPAPRTLLPALGPDERGFIREWLFCGPRLQKLSDSMASGKPEAEFRRATATRLHSTNPGIQGPFVEFASPFPDDKPLRWQVVRVREDRFLYGTVFAHTPHSVHCWAIAHAEVEEDWSGEVRLTSNGPADVWVNGSHAWQVDHFSLQAPVTATGRLDLPVGQVELLVRFTAIALRASPMVMALQLPDPPAAAWFVPADSRWAKEHREFSEVLDDAYLNRSAFDRASPVTLHWPETKPLERELVVRLQRTDGRIYSEQQTQGRKLPFMTLGNTYQYPQDEYEILVLPPLVEYYTHNRRHFRRFSAWLNGNVAYSDQHFGTWNQRRTEALHHAAAEKGTVFHEMARLELGQWDQVDWEQFRTTAAEIVGRADCSDFHLTGILGSLLRWGDESEFPADLRTELRNVILGFRYWMDEPGQDAMCFWTENHQILFHTCEILAGQLYPRHRFGNSGLTGAEHQALGERRALAWLRKRAAGGFREWDSNTYFEEDVLALTHLADLAEDETVHEMAVVVLDKLFFCMAVNSYRGVFGSTHGRSYAPYLKAAYREPTSGLGRMLWGMGMHNDHVLGTVSLACAVNYRLPPVIEAIARDPAAEIWSRERHAGELEPELDRESGTWEVNKATFRTPDYMLAAAQDHRPGEPGVQEHIWQATLSPEAVVFVTHPPLTSEDGSHRPNYWHGHVRLPRVAQDRDVLFALHDLGEDDWMGFTHAHFPAQAFDAYYIQRNWAFGMKGNGYLALTASAPLRMAQTGPTARQDLRAAGPQVVWTLQMGRREQDGEFRDFRARVLELPLEVEGLDIRFESLRGDRYEFGWTGPLLKNGEEVPLSGYPHIDNPYTATPLNAESMEIQFQDLLLRLHMT